MQIVQICDPLNGGVTAIVQVMDVKIYQYPDHPTMQYARLQYVNGRVQDRVWIARDSSSLQVAAE